MRDGGNERHAPYAASQSNTSHFGRTGSRDFYTASKSQILGQYGSRSRQSGAISPPPLKRQRTSSDNLHSGASNSGSINLRIRPPTDPSALRHSFNGQTDLLSKTSRREDSPEPSRPSLSFQALPSDPQRERVKSNTALRHNYATPAERPRHSIPSSKRVCRICEKTNSTTYNPIIACPGCQRAYHDSCRTPRLTSGADPQQWRCSTCLNGPGKRKSSCIPSNPICTKHSATRELFKPRSAHSSLTATSSSTPREVTSNNRTGPHTSHEHTSGKRLYDSQLFQNKPLGQPPPRRSELTEIPKTPTLRSSQLDIPDRTCEPRQRVEPSLYASSLAAPPQFEEYSSSMVLCSVCREQSLAAKTGNDDARRVCRKRPLNIGTWKLEIPETPDTLTTRNVPIPSSLELGNLTASSAIPAAAAETAPALPVGSRHLLKNSKRKPGDDETAYSSTELQESVEPATSLPVTAAEKGQGTVPIPEQTKRDSRQNDALPVPRSPIRRGEDLDPASEESTVLNRGGSIRLSLSALKSVSEMEQLITPRLSPVKKSMVRNGSPDLLDAPLHDIPNPACERAGMKTYTSMLKKYDIAPTTGGPLQMVDVATKSVLRKVGTQVQASEESSSIQEVQQDDVEDVFQEPQHNNAAVESDCVNNGTLDRSQHTSAPMDSSNFRHVARTPSHHDVSTTTNLGDIAVPEAETQYTNRQLAQIALVMANDSGMTTLQIIDWVAGRFSYKQKGQDEWQKSLKSVLSLKSEFRGDKPVGGASGSSTLYSFPNAAFRAQFETEHRQHRANSKFASKQTPKEHRQDRRQTTTQSASETALTAKPSKAIKSAPSRRTQISLPTEPDINVSITSGGTLAKTTSSDDPSFNPFERSAEQRSAITLDSCVEIKRVTSFHKLRLQPQKPSVETMTPEEKALKIAEITARPSRKKFFGSDHRLAHVRRYGRQDVHDESDGAWKPSPLQTDEQAVREDDVVKESEDPRTLRELFNLPANAIPMNDGQELAFRDGTLVNGRLPRSRQSYRVGKVFGGELTTRLS